VWDRQNYDSQDRASIAALCGKNIKDILTSVFILNTAKPTHYKNINRIVNTWVTGIVDTD